MLKSQSLQLLSLFSCNISDLISVVPNYKFRSNLTTLILPSFGMKHGKFVQLIRLQYNKYSFKKTTTNIRNIDYINPNRFPTVK